MNEVSQAFNRILEAIRSVSEQIQVSTSSDKYAAGTEQINASLARVIIFEVC